MSNRNLLAIAFGVSIAALGCSSATAPRSSELSRFNAEYVEAKLAYSELRELSKARTHRCEPRGGDTVVYIGRTEDGLTACLEENPTASVLSYVWRRERQGSNSCSEDCRRKIDVS